MSASLFTCTFQPILCSLILLVYNGHMVTFCWVYEDLLIYRSKSTDTRLKPCSFKPINSQHSTLMWDKGFSIQ